MMICLTRLAWYYSTMLQAHHPEMRLASATHRGSSSVQRAPILLDALHREACDASNTKIRLSQ